MMNFTKLVLCGYPTHADRLIPVRRTDPLFSSSRVDGKLRVSLCTFLFAFFLPVTLGLRLPFNGKENRRDRSSWMGTGHDSK